MGWGGEGMARGWCDGWGIVAGMGVYGEGTGGEGECVRGGEGRGGRVGMGR